MKKLISATLLLFLTTVAFSQIRFGIQGGASLNDYRYNISDESVEAQDTKPRGGFNIGLVAEVTLADKLKFQPGLQFTTRGTSFDDEGLGDDEYSRSTVNYLELPLNVSYTVLENVNVFAGPYLAFTLGGTTKDRFSGISEEFDIKPVSGELKVSEIDASNDYINNFDYGINVGFGYNLSENMNLRLGYTLGLNNMFFDVVDDLDDGFDESLNADEIKVFNRSLSLSLIYFFN